jgi:hypothetical protein
MRSEWVGVELSRARLAVGRPRRHGCRLPLARSGSYRAKPPRRSTTAHPVIAIATRIVRCDAATSSPESIQSNELTNAAAKNASTSHFMPASSHHACDVGCLRIRDVTGRSVGIRVGHIDAGDLAAARRRYLRNQELLPRTRSPAAVMSPHRLAPFSSSVAGFERTMDYPGMSAAGALSRGELRKLVACSDSAVKRACLSTAVSAPLASCL